MNILIPSDDVATTTTTPDTNADVCASLVIGDSTTNQGGSITDLITASRLTDPALARAGVEDGTYAAAVIIPENFTEGITYTGPTFTFTPVQIEVYGDVNRSISSSVVRS
ncbi:MAG TPA: hypothetical protein PLZ51_28530, partial [Aggregatilineales bacterium]|nr:hypothetical protein [Aggregatilineales bacterium]